MQIRACCLVVCPLAALLLCGCASGALPSYSSPPPGVAGVPPLRVYPPRYPIVIDGNQEEWKKVRTVRFEDEGTPEPAKNYVEVGLCWDERRLYVCFVVDDRELYSFSVEHDDRRCRDDSVVVLIDTHNNKGAAWQGDDVYYQVNLLEMRDGLGQAGPRPRVIDHRGMVGGMLGYDWDGEVRARVALGGTLNESGDADHGYVVEMAIPWQAMGVTPRAGQTRLGLNLAVYDRDAKESEYHHLDWVGTGELLRPDRFREIVLVK